MTMRTIVERKTKDRRQRDAALPNGIKYDRRRQAERRAIEVTETSLDEFALAMAKYRQNKAA